MENNIHNENRKLYNELAIELRAIGAKILSYKTYREKIRKGIEPRHAIVHASASAVTIKGHTIAYNMELYEKTLALFRKKYPNRLFYKKDVFRKRAYSGLPPMEAIHRDITRFARTKFK